MYKKWLGFTEKHPYISILVAAVIASLIGIAIEYLVNREFIAGGFGVTVMLVVGQIMLTRRKRGK